MRIRILLLAAIFSWVSVAYPVGQGPASGPGPGKVFLYTAKKMGIPVLKASLHIENGPSLPGKPLYQIRVEVSSVNLGFFLQMNNRFTSTFEAESCVPVQYVKEIDQSGLFKEKKQYLQTLTFDPQRQKVIVEKAGEKERQEVPVPPETFDPLSMFGRCYLKENLQAHQEIRMTIYDGVKLRHMLFLAKEERITSKVLGEVETICLEATTSFASFGDKEGLIRIWYTKDMRKMPVLMELDLPVGVVKFELDEIRES